MLHFTVPVPLMIDNVWVYAGPLLMFGYISHQGGHVPGYATAARLVKASKHQTRTHRPLYQIVRTEQIITHHTQSSLSYLEKDVGLQPRDADRF